MQLKWALAMAFPTLPVWQPAVIQAITPINLGNLMRS
jgi:hypothetical protein